jgi:hypothetical protein
MSQGDAVSERELCEACERGDHANCGMQSWCSCTDLRDGDQDAIADTELEFIEEENIW